MKQKKGNWAVTMKCEVLKLVECSDCTEEEARNNPFEHSDSEREIDQMDWNVEKVESND